MKVMAILDKGGIINNIIMCADDFPEAPNERIDITSSPWLRIGDPIDLEDPSTIELETIEVREQEFMARMGNLDKQQIRPLATLYVLKQASPEDENILYMAEMQKQAYRNVHDELMITAIRDWQPIVEAEYVRITS